MTKRPRVTVLGSLNMDISVTVPRLPGPGATVLGSSARFTPGGKGANQAVAAARLGADVRMVGCVGDDDFGRQLLANLQAEGINADAVRTVPGAPTGVALITVDRSGENLITVAPGANHVVGPPEVAAATAGQADILVISAEIPVEAIAQALAGASGVTSVLNLAPVPENARALVAGVADHLDYLVVNESEAAAVLGRDVDGLAAAQRAATELAGTDLGGTDLGGTDLGGTDLGGTDLAASGPRHAVVTAGAHGAALAGPDGPAASTGFRVEPVDAVGAGDTFVGALAVALAAGVPAAEAIRAAAAAGAAAVTRHGAQAAMPRPPDILAVTGLTWPVAQPGHTDR
jgi:ribokinase